MGSGSRSGSGPCGGEEGGGPRRALRAAPVGPASRALCLQWFFFRGTWNSRPVWTVTRVCPHRRVSALDGLDLTSFPSLVCDQAVATGVTGHHHIHCRGKGSCTPSEPPPKVPPGARALCPATLPPRTRITHPHTGLQRAFIYLAQSIHYHRLLILLLLK